MADESVTSTGASAGVSTTSDEQTQGANWWSVFRAMAREERRLHTELFGGRRFAFLPAFVWAASALAVAGLSYSGTPPTEISTGAHVLVLGFGLYTGTAALVGDNLLDRVLGETALLLSVPDFLPVSRRRVLAAFVAKDAVYYTALFVLPIAVGFAPLVATGALTPLSLAGLWISLALAFAVGMTVTFALVAVRTRGVPGWLLGLLAGGGAVTAWLTGNANTVWSATVATGPLHALALLAALGVTNALALRVYDPSFREPAATTRTSLSTIADVLGDDTGLVARTLLDLSRSSGGLLKPVVSTAILLGLAAFLAEATTRVVGITPSPGIFFGSILGLSAFTTYNWLTQFDAVEEYLRFPVTVQRVFRAKRTAFLLTGLPTGAAAYGVVCVIYDVSLADAVLGCALFLGLSLYLFGLTVAIAGLDPNEFLFDTTRFSLLTIGVAVPIVPALLAGFTAETASLTPPLVVGCLAGSFLFAAVGMWLAARAGPRWETTYLDG